MTRCQIALSIGWAIVLTGSHATGEPWRLGADATLRLASEDESREALARKDVFLDSLSPFDRAVRLKSAREVSQEEYQRHVSAQVRPWTDDDRQRLDRALAPLTEKLAQWSLPWPKEVLLVKTSGDEEPGASGYCRGPAVVLAGRVVNQPPERLADLVCHELFHVLSNQNPALRRKLYAIVGFEPCTPIVYPAPLAARRITNPDAPTADYFIRVEADGRPVAAVPILYSATERYDPAKGGGLFDYLTFRLLAIDKTGERWAPALTDGHPVLLEPDKTPSYQDQLGRNTKYIIHPEEVLADNFVLLVRERTDVPSPQVLRKMRAALQEATSDE